MDPERRRQIEQRNDYASWRGRSAYGTGPPLRGFTLTSEALAGREIQRMDQKSGPPPRTTTFWRRPGGSPEEVLRVDVYELPSVDAAHNYVIELLNEFQSTEIKRREQPPIGDVCFGTPLVILFARANIVALLRNAGRAVVEVVGPARELDDLLVGILTRAAGGR